MPLKLENVFLFQVAFTQQRSDWQPILRHDANRASTFIFAHRCSLVLVSNPRNDVDDLLFSVGVLGTWTLHSLLSDHLYLIVLFLCHYYLSLGYEADDDYNTEAYDDADGQNHKPITVRSGNSLRLVVSILNGIGYFGQVARNLRIGNDGHASESLGTGGK